MAESSQDFDVQPDGVGVFTVSDPKVKILYQGSTASEFAGNPFPRPPYFIEIDFSGTVIERVEFWTSDGLQETWQGAGLTKSWELDSSWEFATGLVQASAQGGKFQGLELQQPLDEAKYPWAVAGFDPVDPSQWVNLWSEARIHLDQAWWTSAQAVVPPSTYVADAVVRILFREASGYTILHKVNFKLYTPDPV